MSFLRLRGFKVGLAVFGVGGSAAAYQVQTDEGTRRSITFWKQIFPIYLHYRTYQLLNRDLNILSKEYAEAQYERLNEEYTEQVKNIVYTMRGFYLKQAQIMSTQDDFVPSAYMRWVKDTQDKVPSEYPGIKARNYVREVLMQEQGLDFDEVFSDWQDDAIGVASIGQVHKAVLRATGEVLAVKFLVPGIEAKFRSDIRTLKSFCKLAMPQHESAFDEIEKQFCTGMSLLFKFLHEINVGNLYLSFRV
jgi:aarF domain-containing kinase